MVEARLVAGLKLEQIENKVQAHLQDTGSLGYRIISRLQQRHKNI
jgi:hypothetical protein